MNESLRSWQRMFAVAALFNFSMGLPIMFASRSTFGLAYGPTGGIDDPTVLMFWRDFGFMVVLIGVGYVVVAVRPEAHIGIVWLGIPAKLFDVVVLTSRWAAGLANPIVLIPAAIDGAFAIAFAAFLRRTRRMH
jgi:hypothetical protein